MVCGSISPVPSYVQGKGEVAVKEEFVKQVEVYKEYDIDFIVAEVRISFLLCEFIARYSAFLFLIFSSQPSGSEFPNIVTS